MATESAKVRLRRQRIREQVDKDGQVTVSALSALLGVTTITIRSDLDVLASAGELIRVPGGAVARVPAAKAEHKEEIEYLAEKEAIAAQALARIADGSTLFLNSGTTCLCMARALLCRERLNVVTNSVAVARELSRRSSFRVVLLGGEMNADYDFTYGGDAQEQLRRYQPDWAILSVDGICAQRGITTHHAEEAILSRQMLAQARQGILIADHRKIGRAGFSHITDVAAGQIVITDHQSDAQAVEALRQAGVEVCVAQVGERHG